MKAVFAKSCSLGSWIIRLFTFSKWSHVAVLLPEGDSIIHSTLKTGVECTSFDTFKRKYTIEIVEISVPNESMSINFLLSQLGKPYDLTALLGLVMQRKWQEEDSWFCSELLEAALIAGGRQRFRDSVSRIVPKESYAVL